MKRVLLLGGSGFIGGNLAPRLSRAGHFVVIGTRRHPAVAAAFRDAPIAVAATDLADVAGIERLLVRHGIDTVIHLACALGPASTQAERLHEQETVLAPAEALMHILAKRGIALVYFSSGGMVYGNSPAERLREDDPCAPISPYGLSKLECESIIENIGRSEGLHYLILRPSNPYGPRQQLHGRQGLVSVILGKLITREPLSVWGSGTAVRDYIHIDDLTDAVAILLGSGVDRRTLNLGSGIGHSLLDVVGIVEDIAKTKIPLEFQPPRAIDAPRVVLDVSAIRALGVGPARSLPAGIRDYMQFLGLIGA